MTSWDIVFLLHDASRTNFYLVTNDDSFMRLYLQLTFKQVPTSSLDAGDSFHKRFPNRFIMCHSSPKLKRTRISRFSRRLSRPPRRWASHTFCRTPPRSSSYSVIYGLLCHSAKSQLWNWVMADWKGRPWSLSTPHPHPSSQYSLCALSSLSFFFFFVMSFSPCSFSDTAIDLLSSGLGDLADSTVRKWIFQPTLDWLHLWLATLSGHGARCSKKGKRERDEEKDGDRNDFYCTDQLESDKFKKIDFMLKHVMNFLVLQLHFLSR